MEAQRAADPTLGLASRVIGAKPAGSQALTLFDPARAPEGLIPTSAQEFNTAPVLAPPGKTVTATHWSNQADLDAILAGKRGSRGPWGGESNRLTGDVGDEVGPRSFWYLGREGDVPREQGVGSIPYTRDLPGIYELQKDPDKLYQQAFDTVRRQYAQRSEYLRSQGGFAPQVTEPQIRDEAVTLFEQLLRDRGYRGVLDRNAKQGPVITVFEDVDLTGQMDTMAMRQELDKAAARDGLIGIEQMGAADEVGRAIGTEYPRQKGGKTPGKYAGSPGEFTKPQALSALTTRLKGLARKGAAGMEWYERDTQNIANLTSGDAARAYPLANAIAVTSPQTKVQGNAMEGLRASYQGLVGQPYSAGRFEGDMAETLTRTMDDPAADLGRKRASFRGNLLKWWDEVKQGTTEDMQMARAAGFEKDSLGEAQYDFLERTVARISDQLNAERKLPTDPYWTPERVQAAIWTGQKAKKEARAAEEAGANLADAMAGANASVPFEARSNAVPALASGKGPANTLYFNDIDHLQTDPFGNNVVARELGLYQTPQFRGQGVWGEERNQNAVMQAPVPLVRAKDIDADMAQRGYGILEPITKDGRKVGERFKFSPDATREQRYLATRMKARVDLSARQALDTLAVTQGGLLGQEGAAWARFTAGGKRYAQNAVRVEMPDFKRQDLTKLADTITALKKTVDPEDTIPLVVQPTKNGVEVYRPMIEDMTEEGAAVAMKNDATMRKIIEQALKKVEPYYERMGYGKPTETWGMMDSAYFQESWGDYAAQKAARPNTLQRRAEAVEGLLGPAIKAHQDWVNRYYR
ncbi:MAG: hypothetical protein MUE39_10360 [Gammaproteobacteria bacterium]|nr:hypothetical protein [Gammaproteobacteria bacterium]